MVLVASLLSAGTEALGWLGGYDRAFYDLCHRQAGQRTEPQNVALVVVDDATLVRLRDKPQVFWGPHFARAIEVLRQVGARIVGLDYLFLVSVEGWLGQLGADAASRTYDAEFRTQLASGGVVLIGLQVTDQDDRNVSLLPIDDYLMVLPNREADIGWANLRSDSDGVVRHFLPALFEQGPHPRLTLGALLAVRGAGLDPDASSWDFGGQRVGSRLGSWPIHYAGPPGSVATVSFARLLEDGARTDPQVAGLKDKVVIIGAGDRGGQDMHLTPYGRDHMMNGGEVHANIVETLLTGNFPERIGDPARFLILVLVVGLASFGFFWLGPMWGAVFGILLGGLLALAAYLLFLAEVILPVASGHLGLVLCYLGAIGMRLTGEERRRRYLRRVFGQYVTDEVVERLLGSGRRPDLGGELLTVTVLFSDIREFTTMSERLNAHEVVEMLNTYFGQACEAIFAQGGTIDKFVGDAIMAVFGSPVPYGDHARRALKAALAIHRIADEFRGWLSHRFSGRDLPEFRIGVGIHTGEAVVGNIGSPKRLEYTAIGDTVNMAARLEGLTKQLEARIVVSGQTQAAAGAGLVMGQRHNIRLKGKEDQVEVVEFEGFE